MRTLLCPIAFLAVVHLYIVVVSCRQLVGKCVSISSPEVKAALPRSCENVVNYDFFVSDTESLDDLRLRAVQKLEFSGIPLLESSCRANYKLFACSSAYRKCLDGIDINNVSTWDFSPYEEVGVRNVAIPFQRIWWGVCMQLEMCAEMMSLIGVAVTCADRTNFVNDSLLPRPLSFTHDKRCMGMDMSMGMGPRPGPPALSIVVSTSEPYLFPQTGVCRGIVRKVYPVNTTLSITMDLYDAPGQMQIWHEAELTKLLESVPNWVCPACRTAMIRYLCALKYPIAHTRTMGDLLRDNKIDTTGISNSILSTSVVVPCFSDKTVCRSYESTCKDLFTYFGENIKSPIRPDCDQLIEIGGGCRDTKVFIRSLKSLFPDAGFPYEVIPSLRLPNAIISNFNMTSTTTVNAYLNNPGVQGYKVQCPIGFVVPSDPNDKSVDWVPGTGCAVGCRRFIYTEAEFNRFQQFGVVLCACGIPLIIYLIFIFWLEYDERTQSAILILFAATAFVNTSLVLVSLSDTIFPFERKFCRSNAVGLDYSDGFTYCAFQSIVGEYVALVNLFAWCTLCLDAYAKAMFSLDLNKYVRHEIFVCCGLPLITTLYKICKQTYGYDRNILWCTQARKYGDGAELALFYLPVMVLTFFGMAALVAVMLKYCFTVSLCSNIPAEEDNSSKDSSSSSSSSRRSLTSNASSSLRGISLSVREVVVRADKLRTSILFLSIYLLVWISMCMFRGYSVVSNDRMEKSFDEWTKCVFANFKNSEDTSYLDICGSHLSFRKPDAVVFLAVFCAAGGSLLFSIIHIHLIYKRLSIWLANISKAVLPKRHSVAPMPAYRRHSTSETRRRRRNKPRMIGAGAVYIGVCEGSPASSSGGDYSDGQIRNNSIVSKASLDPIPEIDEECCNSGTTTGRQHHSQDHKSEPLENIVIPVKHDPDYCEVEPFELEAVVGPRSLEMP